MSSMLESASMRFTFFSVSISSEATSAEASARPTHSIFGARMPGYSCAVTASSPKAAISTTAISVPITGAGVDSATEGSHSIAGASPSFTRKPVSSRAIATALAPACIAICPLSRHAAETTTTAP